MTRLEFQPFDKQKLIADLKTHLPQYKIQTTWGALQVRTSGFTATGNVALNAKPQKGHIRTQTNFDLRVVYFLFCWPMGLYIYLKKDKQKAMEAEVIECLNKILEKK